jgi:hypothetical protein
LSVPLHRSPSFLAASCSAILAASTFFALVFLEELAEGVDFLDVLGALCVGIAAKK